jgi:ribonuclease P/MRP protein subunit POP1
MFHTKRAHMSLPSQPLWRFAIPLSPTIKCYRPTHRSANERGAIAWDTSYFATIGLQGQQRSIDGLLRAMGVLDMGDDCRSRRWHKGTRVWEGYLREREDQHKLIAPATVIWAVETSDPKQQKARPTEEHTRKVLLRIHPSAFMQTWEELLRLSKVAKPQVKVEDLRFEIGSIEITGPGATETLLGALWPTKTHDASKASRTAEDVWNSLNGLNNPSMLPQNALLAFDIQDPRLHHPPRTIKPPTSSEHELDLLNVLAEWPVDETHEAAKIFGRQARLKASSSLPSQKAINRRRTLAVPGQYPESLVNDPSIPTLLYCVADSAKSPAKWVVLLPWRCVLPVWYSIMYYPLSSGGQPRFGGLQQIRQLAFEAGRPWFPADFPGTAAGMTWESSERKRREDEWRRKPKSKRTNWDAVDLGEGRRGEIGIGWACDWERLVLGAPTIRSDSNPSDTSPEGATAADQPRESSTSPKFIQVPRDDVKGPLPLNALAAVSIILTNRGVPETCARIYRLPTSPFHRKQWLTLRTSGGKQQNRARIGIPRIADDTPPHIAQQRLAQSLLAPIRPGQCDYPTCPGEEDLIGFVTSGNFNMGEGKGTGVGNILLSKIPSVLKGEAEIDRWCVVRNAGESIGRLAQWTFAS